jgi:hypothetical protein
MAAEASRPNRFYALRSQRPGPVIPCCDVLHLIKLLSGFLLEA